MTCLTYITDIVLLIRYTLVTYQTPVSDYAQLQQWQYSFSSMMAQMLKLKLKSKKRFWQNSGEKLNAVHASWECCAQRGTPEIFAFWLVEDINYDFQNKGRLSKIHNIHQYVYKLRKMGGFPSRQSRLEKACF